MLHGPSATLPTGTRICTRVWPSAKSRRSAALPRLQSVLPSAVAVNWTQYAVFGTRSSLNRMIFWSASPTNGRTAARGGGGLEQPQPASTGAGNTNAPSASSATSVVPNHVRLRMRISSTVLPPPRCMGPVRCMFRAAPGIREKPEFQGGKGVRWAPRRATWHMLRRTRVAAGTLLPLASGRVTGRRGGGLRRHREDDGEGGALADRALDGDVAPPQAREAAREPEAQADAVAPPVRRAELAEHVEHGPVGLARDAGARVAHPDGEPAGR